MTSSFSKKSPQFYFLNVQMLYTHFSMVGSLKNMCTCNRLYEFLLQDIKFGGFINQLQYEKLTDKTEYSAF